MLFQKCTRNKILKTKINIPISGSAIKNQQEGIVTITSGEVSCSGSDISCTAIENTSANKLVINGGEVKADTRSRRGYPIAINSSAGEIEINEAAFYSHM